MFHVYILASINRVLYVGSSDNLTRRLAEHKRGRADAFTARYRMRTLMQDAIRKGVPGVHGYQVGALLWR